MTRTLTNYKERRSSNDPLAVPRLPSALKSRSSTSQKATPTSRNDARNAARHGSQSNTATVVIELHARCSPRPAPSAVKAPKFPFNLAVISRFTAAIATVKSDQVDKCGQAMKVNHRNRCCAAFSEWCGRAVSCGRLKPKRTPNGGDDRVFRGTEIKSGIKEADYENLCRQSIL